MQDCGNSIANALELLQFCTKLSKCIIDNIVMNSTQMIWI